MIFLKTKKSSKNESITKTCLACFHKYLSSSVTAPLDRKANFQKDVISITVTGSVAGRLIDFTLFWEIVFIISPKN